MSSTTVWADNQDHEAGRHRRGTAVLAPPTASGRAARRATRHTRAEVSPVSDARPPVDPMVDSGSVGLRMFNLGTIPASVTPPRSWRRAAWFTIVASAAALLGLLAVGTVLVAPARSTGRTVALPVFPSGVPLAAIGGASSVRQVSVRLSTSVADTGRTVRVAPPRRSVPANVGAPASAPDPVIATLPPGTSVAGGGEPVIDPTKLIKQTKTFFAEVTSNAQAAADLTDQTVRDDALALIRQKYGDVSTIQIQSMSLDPNNGLTVSVLRVVNKDGTTTTQQTTLRFTLTGDPKITNPGG
ncbi:MAG TPA: hypothetical protein VGD84_01635 [Pseudonocardiaceae bacterium]